MENQNTEKIGMAIMQNGDDVVDWAFCDLSWKLYWWIAFFNIAFFKAQPVKTPILSFERKSVKNQGRYARQRNGFGFNENININRCHLDRPLWEILVVLIHEMCHSWQSQYGTPARSWFHNKEFKLKMLKIGIETDSGGRHLKVKGPFVFLLEKHGIKFGCPKNAQGEIKMPQDQKPKGKSKLKKWECLCGQSARVGKKEFHAICKLCEGEFALVE